jgi:uncharacterized protein
MASQKPVPLLRGERTKPGVSKFALGTEFHIGRFYFFIDSFQQNRSTKSRCWGLLFNVNLNPMDKNYLRRLAAMRMPFGKYAGVRLVELPEPYVVWFSRKGFPEGELGEMLRAVYEIKVNGLEGLFKPIIESENRDGT